MKRPDIDDRILAYLIFCAAVVLTTYFGFFPELSQEWKLPGSPCLYLSGVAGSVLLLVSVLFVLAKRTGLGGSPPAWFIAHVFTGTVGAVLVSIHSAGRLRYAPALLLAALLGLIILGVWARIRLSRRISATFATRYQSFAPFKGNSRYRLFAVIRKKEQLLRRLDPAAREGTFSLKLEHWVKRPIGAFTYAFLVFEENRILGSRSEVDLSQAYWRIVHVALAALFVAGLIGHVVVVTLFAGYVSGGEEIYWWHLASW